MSQSVFVKLTWISLIREQKEDWLNMTDQSKCLCEAGPNIYQTSHSVTKRFSFLQRVAKV